MSENLQAVPQGASPDAKPVLHVCVTCRRNMSAAEIGDSPVAGRQLFERMAALADTADFELRPVECLSSCKRGCSAVLSMPSKWTLLLGGLGPETADDLKTCVDVYRNSKTGAVPASKTPPSLNGVVIARVPAAVSPA